MKRIFIESALLAAILACASACERDARSSERMGGTTDTSRDAGAPPGRELAGYDASGMTSSAKGYDAATLSAQPVETPDASREIARAAPLQITGVGGSGGIGGSGSGGSGGTFGTGGTVTGGSGGVGGSGAPGGAGPGGAAGTPGGY